MVSTAAMLDTDFGTFDRAFRRLSGAFRVKLKAGELDELTRTYFKVLIDAPLDDVLAGAKACLVKCKRFPTVAEWLDELPGGRRPFDVSDVRVMLADEAAHYTRAERRTYEDEPCSCIECDRAGVTHRFLRFVPDFTDDGRDERAVHPPTGRIVVPGHWAHGEELAAWYRARDAFFALPRGRRFRKLLAAVAEREPGQEG